ncbi:MAG: type II toxin-antitoxin system death-on-curing family toxin [Candidatus Nitronauta litoralis]|uniref:Type II toxin-antitoxin system death-on-curing family toxin n=1 Tax=Candidatus Nitronauta litoralis TaxID=2705533 RepID=A0A7T0G017_9BACT|nr:MAG: type II toxin-antitoxin system death-on-curing family toxin [Candidatus Nitronauta litoralis]
MKEPIWINPKLVLLFHEQLIVEHGGQAGIRDQGLLKAAMARPEQIFSNGEPDLFDLAAAYTSEIIRNHPFIDGNKRTAFLVGAHFLEINGQNLIAPEAETTQAILDLVTKKLSEEDFAIWLMENSKKKNLNYEWFSK